MFEQPINFWSKHVILSSLSHAVGGFGAAILLQHYLVGNAFLPAIVGWITVAFTAVTHFIAYASKE
ncbi:MAG: hypothetical protein V1858_05160 [Candidatus Gottesmanbacteria bacterium]